MRKNENFTFCIPKVFTGKVDTLISDIRCILQQIEKDNHRFIEAGLIDAKTRERIDPGSRDHTLAMRQLAELQWPADTDYRVLLQFIMMDKENDYICLWDASGKAVYTKSMGSQPDYGVKGVAQLRANGVTFLEKSDEEIMEIMTKW